jgi:hypothetical protein
MEAMKKVVLGVGYLECPKCGKLFKEDVDAICGSCVAASDCEECPQCCNSFVLVESEIDQLRANMEKVASELAERTSERDDAVVRWESLTAELWRGVKAHGLTAPKRGRDGERLIHAYCGEIVRLRAEVARLTPPTGMDVAAIVAWFLDVNGYDGLYLPDVCSCAKDELFPGTDCPDGECAPGVKVPCICGGGCNYDIGSRTLARAELAERATENTLLVKVKQLEELLTDMLAESYCTSAQSEGARCSDQHIDSVHWCVVCRARAALAERGNGDDEDE